MKNLLQKTYLGINTVVGVAVSSVVDLDGIVRSIESGPAGGKMELGDCLGGGELRGRRSLNDSSSEKGVVRLELFRVEVESGVHDTLTSTRVGRVARLCPRIVIENEILKYK
jgi:hypothetical protein